MPRLCSAGEAAAQARELRAQVRWFCSARRSIGRPSSITPPAPAGRRTTAASRPVDDAAVDAVDAQPRAHQAAGRLQIGKVNDGELVGAVKAIAAASWPPMISNTCWPGRTNGEHGTVTVVLPEGSDARRPGVDLGAIANGRLLVVVGPGPTGTCADRS